MPSDDTLLGRSISDLEALAIDRGAYESGRVAWLSRALVSPLGQLGPAEFRLLMQHARGLPWILPLVVDRLAREPFTPIDGEPAALLLAALVVPLESWRAQPDALRRLVALLPPAIGSPLALPTPIRRRLEDDGAIFLELAAQAGP
jgi:hypothetical protein